MKTTSFKISKKLAEIAEIREKIISELREKIISKLLEESLNIKNKNSFINRIKLRLWRVKLEILKTESTPVEIIKIYKKNKLIIERKIVFEYIYE